VCLLAFYLALPEEGHFIFVVAFSLVHFTFYFIFIGFIHDAQVVGAEGGGGGVVVCGGGGGGGEEPEKNDEVVIVVVSVVFSVAVAS
jgi:hypothetical protein